MRLDDTTSTTMDEDVDAADPDVIINDVGDSLPAPTSTVVESSADEERRIAASIGQGDDDDDDDDDDVDDDDDDTADLPSSLIVTNLDETVFDSDVTKAQFECLFEPYGDVTFQYFKSFRRAKVNFPSAQIAAAARIELHQAVFCDKMINCYFAQPVSPKDDSKDPYLQPPSPVKQFLISPPASPPVGWEPVDEAQPMINYDLLSALANMAPGESHELHPPSESQPGIVVHPCEENGGKKTKPVIQHTSCPERKA